MSITGRIKTLFFDKNNSEAIFPRTKVKAVSDDENRGLDFLLENIDTQLLNLQGQVNSKAPMGYGLGTEAQFIPPNELLSDYSNTGFYRWSAENIDPNKPFSSGEMIAIKHNKSLGWQIAFRGDTYQQEIKTRKKYTNKWTEWENWSPSSFAPSGYGFGGKPVSLATGFLNDDAILTVALEDVYSQMGSTETKLVRFAGYPSNSDYNWFGFLSKSSANYGSLVVYSAFARGACVIKTKFNGVWEPLEWVNPPMVMGVEYRTTERYNGKSVYTTLVSVGNLPNKNTASISHGFGVKTAIRSIGTIDDTSTIPYSAWGNTIDVTVTPSSIVLTTNYDASAIKAKVQMWYTKN